MAELVVVVLNADTHLPTVGLSRVRNLSNDNSAIRSYGVKIAVSKQRLSSIESDSRFTDKTLPKNQLPSGAQAPLVQKSHLRCRFLEL